MSQARLETTFEKGNAVAVQFLGYLLAYFVKLCYTIKNMGCVRRRFNEKTAKMDFNPYGIDRFLYPHRLYRYADTVG